MPVLPVSLLVVVAAATTLTFSYCSRCALLRRDQPGAPAFTALMILMSVVPMVVLGVQWLDVRRWYLVPSVLFYVYAPLWVWFVLTYIGEEHTVSRGKLVLFVTPLVIGALNVATALVAAPFENNLAETIRLVTDLYAFTLLFGGTLLLVRAGYTFASIETRRILSLALGALLPVLVPLTVVEAYFGGTPVLDSYLIGYVLSAISFGTAVRDGGLFRSGPVAEAIGRDVVVTEMNDGIIVVAGDDRIVDVNPAARELLELDDRPIHNEPVELLFAADVALPADGESTEIPVADGTRILDVSTTSLSGPIGDVGRILTLRDVTERVRRRQQLQRLNRQNDRLDRFVSVVSHDLRNPLNVATGFLDLARNTGDDQYFEKIADAHDRIDSMLEELLTMAQAGITVDDPEQVELDHIVMEAWNTARTADAALELDLAGGKTVEADRNLLRHILENLFRNAAEHNDHPVTVTVGLLEGASEGFYVADDGTGIPAEEREAVFEHGHTTAEDGTGFGLSIVEQFVVAHGWEITVTDSEPGGARFEIVDVAVTVE